MVDEAAVSGVLLLAAAAMVVVVPSHDVVSTMNVPFASRHLSTTSVIETNKASSD